MVLGKANAIGLCLLAQMLVVGQCFPRLDAIGKGGCYWEMCAGAGVAGQTVFPHAGCFLGKGDAIGKCALAPTVAEGLHFP